MAGGYLTQRGIDKAFVTGLATDFCVAWTAMDARSMRLATFVIEDACRGIDTGGPLAAAWAAMDKAGVKRTARVGGRLTLWGWRLIA